MYPNDLNTNDVAVALASWSRKHRLAVKSYYLLVTTKRMS